MIKRINDSPYALVINGKLGEVFTGENAWDRARRAANLHYGHVMIVKLMYGTEGTVYIEPKIKSAWEDYFTEPQRSVPVDPIREQPLTPDEAQPLRSVRDRIEQSVRARGVNINDFANEYNQFNTTRLQGRGVDRSSYMDIYRNLSVMPYTGEGSSGGLIDYVQNSGIDNTYATGTTPIRPELDSEDMPW